jgi:dolichol-phosphate mannosyltransferase
MPAFQKGRVIRETVTNLDSALRETNLNYQIRVVVDGSQDDTESVLRSIDLPTLLIDSYTTNRGKGYALRRGVERSAGELIAFADADPDINPASLVRMIRQLNLAGCDAVVGSKTHPDSVVAYPPLRRLQSRVYRGINAILFGMKTSDTQTGMKVFRAEALRHSITKTHLDGFAFDLELLVTMNDDNFEIQDGPVILDYAFNSTVPLSAAIPVMLDTIKVARRRRSSRLGPN